jgi:hypothetical protein
MVTRGVRRFTSKSVKLEILALTDVNDHEPEKDFKDEG